MIIMIGAASLNNCVGIQNHLPWKISSDLAFFKSTTHGNNIVMGYQTYISLNQKPLPNRTNIVICRNESEQQELNGFKFMTFQTCLKYIQNSELDSFIIGGPKTWLLFKDYYQRCIISRVQTIINGDCYLPDICQNMELKKIIYPKITDKDQFSFIIEIHQR